MRFALHYAGSLKSNGNARHKHELRVVIHRQLSVLWGQPPFKGQRFMWEAGAILPDCRLERGPYQFVPMISQNHGSFAEVAITILRPGPAGAIVNSADIDNRLKTLLDAFRVPDEAPAGNPAESEKPFYVLLSDDKLITSISVQTFSLLEANARQDEVRLLIQVEAHLGRGMKLF